MQVTLPLQTSAPVYAPVRNLMLYVDMDCPLRCDYCFVNKHPHQMQTVIARQAVDFFFDRRISGLENRIEITFFGGEPFLATDLMEEVFTHARKFRPNCPKKLQYSATTSGTLAGPRVEKVVRDAQMSLLVSLDGDLAASSARRYASGRSSYPVVAKNLPRLVSWAKSSIIRMTFHPLSLNLLMNVKHALELGANSVALCPVVEADWLGAERRLEDAYDELAEWFVAEVESGRTPPLEITWRLLKQRAVSRCCGGGRPERPCHVGHGLLAVDVEGNVFPCHRFVGQPARILGHVHTPVLSESRQEYVTFSSRSILGCDDCVAERICGGGCRAVAVDGGFGFGGKHPNHCLLMQAHARAIDKIFESLKHRPEFLASLGCQGPGAKSQLLSELAATGG